MLIPFTWLTTNGDYAGRPADSVRYQTKRSISVGLTRERAFTVSFACQGDCQPLCRWIASSGFHATIRPQWPHIFCDMCAYEQNADPAQRRMDAVSMHRAGVVRPAHCRIRSCFKVAARRIVTMQTAITKTGAEPAPLMPITAKVPDIISAPVPETLSTLRVNPETGLARTEVDLRRREYGYNEVAERKDHPVLTFLGKFWGMSAWRPCFTNTLILPWRSGENAHRRRAGGRQ